VRKLVMDGWLTLDGVAQAPVQRGEDTTGGRPALARASVRRLTVGQPTPALCVSLSRRSGTRWVVKRSE
jgi:hypothetical protein